MVIFCMVMCGGIFKGLYFFVFDLLIDFVVCDQLLFVAMGFFDGCQIDGMGGVYLFISKVVIVSVFIDFDMDVDYLFLQVVVDKVEVSVV